MKRKGRQKPVEQVRSFYQEVGARIARVREADRGLTQEALSSVVTLSRTSLANIECGRQQILLHHFCEIAGALGVAPTDLLPPNEAAFGAEIGAILAKLPGDQRLWIESAIAPAHDRATKATVKQ